MTGEVGHRDDEGEGVERAPRKETVLFFRATDEEVAALDAKWRAQGFRSRSAYLRHLARVDIGAASASPAVAAEVNAAKKQIARLGRNISAALKIVRGRIKSGIDADPRAEITTGDLEALREELRALWSAMDGFLSRSKGRAV